MSPNWAPAFAGVVPGDAGELYASFPREGGGPGIKQRCAPLPWTPAFAGEQRPYGATDSPSALLRTSFTTAGLAFPPIAFIVCPTKNPNSLSFPPR